MREFSNDFYIGEHLFWGNLGEFLILLGLISALTVTIFSFLAYHRKNETLLFHNLSKKFYFIHTFCVIAVPLILIFLFSQQYWEYHYIWRHSSSELPWYYILSAMWEGQEGSFILWIFWHAILGLFVLNSKYKDKYLVLGILTLVQVFLLTMVLGLDVGGKNIGTNPFILLREEMSIPITKFPNYLELIKDGNGLNILLQNYWMVIHPPVLFLGFASLTVPFGFAVSSLINRDYTSWTEGVKSWSLFGLAALGTGILMGGRWAYESLSFGGFWAWDPVENASLVPWLILLAGIHTLLIYRATKHSLRATYLFMILSFVFILYSTFLTRSGILGDTSVHSFTDLGMSGQLLIFIGFLTLGSLLLLAYNWSQIPHVEKEENVSSREFWMFIASLTVIVSAIQITYTTSIPVWNKLFDLKLAPPINANAHYNSIQIWFTLFVIGVMAFILWIKYRSSSWKVNYRTIGFLTLITVLISGIIQYYYSFPWIQDFKLNISDWDITFKFISPFVLLLLASVGLIASSFYYFIKHVVKSNYLQQGGTIAHIGFGVMVLGALISQFHKNPISKNFERIDFGQEFDVEEQSSNTLLTTDTSATMNNYSVNYIGSEKIYKGKRFTVDFSSENQNFTLHPIAKFIQEGPNNTRLQAEPSIKHLWNKDIFVHVSSVPQDEEKESEYTSKEVKLKDTFYLSEKAVAFNKVNVLSAPADKEIKIEGIFSVINSNMVAETLTIPYSLNTVTGAMSQESAFSTDKKLELKIASINPDDQTFEIQYNNNPSKIDWIIVKVLEFPMISILWLGCIIMIVGVLMSFFFKIRKQ